VLGRVTVHSPFGGSVRVRYGAKVVDLAMRPGERVTLDTQLERLRETRIPGSSNETDSS
jgi:hypothetical protein